VSENLELMQKHFPECPVCGSSEGYEPSAFYLDIRCKICRAEWSLFEDGIELKKASEREWDKELLNKRFSFEFWKKLKIPELKLTTEKTFAPMDYLGGHTEYRKPAIGYNKTGLN